MQLYSAYAGHGVRGGPGCLQVSYRLLSFLPSTASFLRTLAAHHVQHLHRWAAPCCSTALHSTCFLVAGKNEELMCYLIVAASVD